MLQSLKIAVDKKANCQKRVTPVRSAAEDTTRLKISYIWRFGKQNYET